MRFNDVQEKRYCEVRLPEHEVLLSFTDDAGAAAFREWWFSDPGLKAFAKWLAGSDYNYLLGEEGSDDQDG